MTTRAVIGSELDDTKKIELDRLGSKISMPVSIYDANGNQVTNFTGSSTPATSVGDGRGSVASAGTPVQLSTVSIPCKRVQIFSIETNGSLANGGIIAVGGSDVSAPASSRKGATIFPANGNTFNVSNLNLLYLDATDSGAVFNYYYEN